MTNSIYGSDVALDFETNDIVFSAFNDFSVVSDIDNLKQAIMTRVLTKKSSLATHKDFGSDIYDMIGQSATVENKNQISSYVFQTLQNESRIQSIDSISVDMYTISTRAYIVLEISVTPIDSDNQLNVVIMASS